jgi:hypothetical protein
VIPPSNKDKHHPHRHADHANKTNQNKKKKLISASIHEIRGDGS